MGVASESQLPVGLRHVRVFELNAAGRPAASDSTPYAGLEIKGPKAFSLSVPAPRKITHYGADRVLATDWLPPNEGASGELRASVHDLAIHALLSGVEVGTIGEAKEVGHATSQQGKEPQVGLLLYQQSVDLVSGAQQYHAIIMPRVKCLPQPAGMGENPEDRIYQIAPAVVSKRLWGTPLSAVTDGITDAQYFEYACEGEPRVVAFKGDGVEDEFSFEAAYPAKATGKVAVFVNGTAQTTGVTVAETMITFTTAPENDADIVVFYEV